MHPSDDRLNEDPSKLGRRTFQAMHPRGHRLDNEPSNLRWGAFIPWKVTHPSDEHGWSSLGSPFAMTIKTSELRCTFRCVPHRTPSRSLHNESSPTGDGQRPALEHARRGAPTTSGPRAFSSSCACTTRGGSRSTLPTSPTISSLPIRQVIGRSCHAQLLSASLPWPSRISSRSDCAFAR
jgi:hypothetical protein